LGALVPKKQLQETKTHLTASDQKTSIDNAFKKAGDVEKISNVVGAVVNHHLLAPDLIAGTLAKISTSDPITIFLISPNHFTKGTGRIITSNLDWSTPYGILPSDRNAIASLTADNFVSVDETPFDEEHGIYNIIPFIKKAFPNAKIVPLILKHNLTDGEADILAQKISTAPNSIAVFSFDFSHYQTKQVADQHDNLALNAIRKFDYSQISSLDIDSKPGFRLMLKYAELSQAKDFELTYHSNSANYTGDESDTVSYIDGLFIKSK
jgi:AmmeMemoRadiSam system protein B